MKTYINDAIIGSKEVKVALTDKGEIVRIRYPDIDFREFIDFLHVGVKINDSNLIYLHNDINNVYNQYYIEDTNVLKTEIKNTYFNLRILQTDFVSMNDKVIMRKYTFINEHDIPLNIDFVIHSKMESSHNNFAGGKIIENGILQYTHDYSLAYIANGIEMNAYRLHGIADTIDGGVIQDKDYIGMTDEVGLSYSIGTMNPGETKEFSIYIDIIDNKDKSKFEDIEKQIDSVRKLDVEKELQNTKRYWKKYVKIHSAYNIEGSPYKDMIRKIYVRSILLYPLLTNANTGGMSAAMEIDETFSKCGRYSYCWPRDAVYITKALDLLRMEKETERFYKVFCKNTQLKNGMWEQRYFTDGKLAPCWGYQVDETAGVIYGVYDHYTRTKDKKFLKDNLKMLEKAMKFLQGYVENLNKEDKQMRPSYDLWEMYEGTTLYSISSIYAAYQAMIKIYDILLEDVSDNRLKQSNIIKQNEIIEKQISVLKTYVLNNFYDEGKKSFVRNGEDKKLDVSMIGAVVPFGMFSPKEKKIVNTVERINMCLRTYTGGYLRFEDDHYTGDRPWVITTLMMALYYIEAKDYKKAKECFDFVVRTSTNNGFLAEQVDNKKMESSWVIGLGWSHALFVIVLDELAKLKKI